MNLNDMKRLEAALPHFTKFSNATLHMSYDSVIMTAVQMSDEEFKGVRDKLEDDGWECDKKTKSFSFKLPKVTR